MNLPRTLPLRNSSGVCRTISTMVHVFRTPVRSGHSPVTMHDRSCISSAEWDSAIWQLESYNFAMAVTHTSSQASLIDVLDRVLDKGIVIDAWMSLSLVGIDLITVEARLVAASIETYLYHSSALGATRSAARPALETRHLSMPLAKTRNALGAPASPGPRVPPGRRDLGS